METIFKALKYYALIFAISWITGIILILLDYRAENMNAIAFSIVIAMVFLIFRKKLDMNFAAKVNMIFFLALLIRFTVLMLFTAGDIDNGNIEIVLFIGFSVLLLPFVTILKVVPEVMLLFVCALLSYFVAFIISAFSARISVKKVIVPGIIAAICIFFSTSLYFNRTSVERSSGYVQVIEQEIGLEE